MPELQYRKDTSRVESRSKRPAAALDQKNQGGCGFMTPFAERAAAYLQFRARGRLGQDPGRPAQVAAAEGTAGGGGQLPHLAAVQGSFGRHDVRDVSAHTGDRARAACDELGAVAYAAGNDVAFAGAPDLHTAAHEAAHVVQQRAGVSLKGGVGQTGDAYEQHADAVADLVVQGKSAEGLLDTMAGAGGGRSAVQCKQPDPSSRRKVTGDTTEERRRTTESEASEAVDEESETEKRQAGSGASDKCLRGPSEKSEKRRRKQRKKRRSRKKKTSEESERKETTRTVEETRTECAPEPAEQVCTLDMRQRATSHAASTAGILINALGLTNLFEGWAVEQAISTLTNHALFASEFEATPDYTRALSDALFGTTRDRVRGRTMKLVKQLGKSATKISTAIFSVMDTLMDEHARAAAAASGHTVKDFINGALRANFRKAASTQRLIVSNSALDTAIAAYLTEKGLETCQRDPVGWMDQIVGEGHRLKAGLRDALKVGTHDLEKVHQGALKLLIEGIVGRGYIDHGDVSITVMESSDGGHFIFPPTGVNTPPKLDGTRDNPRFADAINGYLREFGGSINTLGIEKRIEVTVVFKELLGRRVMRSDLAKSKWTRGHGRAELHAAYLSDDDVTDTHIKVWYDAMRTLGDHVSVDRVVGG